MSSKEHCPRAIRAKCVEVVLRNMRFAIIRYIDDVRITLYLIMGKNIQWPKMKLEMYVNWNNLLPTV